jgi:ABC-2 type transport system ATP-binding protein
MRGDLAASMLHSPDILFLDEPTIGLDVEVKYSIRKFIKEINESRNTTIILTTHDMDDVQALCHRIIIINSGKIVSDSSLAELISKISPPRKLIVDLYTDNFDFSHTKAKILKTEGQRIFLEFGKDISAVELIQSISEKYPIRDLSIEETDIDNIIRQIYKNTGKDIN